MGKAPPYLIPKGKGGHSIVGKSVVREKLLSQDVYAIRPSMVRLVNYRTRDEVAWLRGSHDAGLCESWDDTLSGSQRVNAFLRNQLDGCKHALAFQMMSDQDHFPEPGGCRGNGLRRCLDSNVCRAGHQLLHRCAEWKHRVAGERRVWSLTSNGIKVHPHLSPHNTKDRWGGSPVHLGCGGYRRSFPTDR